MNGARLAKEDDCEKRCLTLSIIPFLCLCHYAGRVLDIQGLHYSLDRDDKGQRIAVLAVLTCSRSAKLIFFSPRASTNVVVCSHHSESFIVHTTMRSKEYKSEHEISSLIS